MIAQPEDNQFAPQTPAAEAPQEPPADQQPTGEATPDDAAPAEPGAEEAPAAPPETPPVSEGPVYSSGPPETEPAAPEAPAAEKPEKKPAAAEAAEEEPVSEVPTEEEAFQEGRVWYIIHTYSGHENKVKTNLEHRIASMDAKDLIFRVIVPTEDEIEIREGQRRTVSRKIFPGYILVQMVELREDDPRSNQAWFVVRNTPGVTGFVGSGTRPVPLEREEVLRILRQMRMEEPRVRVGFAIGESVRIVDGPFQDFVGSVDDLNLEKGKVKVLVSFFGRETPVELDFLQVERL